jgi:hypothetical protein
MTDITPLGRPLTEPERFAFQRLDLTPGHWAALVAAPFLFRRGVRTPLVGTNVDLDRLNRLRWELRSAAGLSNEAGRFWQRCDTELEAPDADLAQRLLAWHLATDLPFARRAAFALRVRRTADHFATRPVAALTDPQGIVRDLVRMVDRYLPAAAFTLDDSADEAPPPTPAVLDAAARRVSAPVLAWPLIEPVRVPALLPVTVRVMGEPVREWWAQPQAPRRAAEIGLANEPFVVRERIYADMQREWFQVFTRWVTGSRARECAVRFVSAVQEWVDAVRQLARLGAELPADEREEETAFTPPLPRAVWECPQCGIENAEALRRCAVCHALYLPVELEVRSDSTGKTMRLEDGAQVGRGEYRTVFEDPDAGLAAADQFRVVRDAEKGMWRVVPIGRAVHPICYDGVEVAPEGHEIVSGGVLSVGTLLRLTVRFV